MQNESIAILSYDEADFTLRKKEKRRRIVKTNCFAVREFRWESRKLAESKSVFINVYVYDSNSINRCVSVKYGAAGTFSVTKVGKFNLIDVVL